MRSRQARRSALHLAVSAAVVVGFVGSIGAGEVFIGATPAHAAVTVANACFWPDQKFHDNSITFDGGAEGGGTTVGLVGLHASMTVPGAYLEIGYASGQLQAGDNVLPMTAWVAIEGSNTREGKQVLVATSTAIATISVDPSGAPHAAPVDASLEFPASQWNAAAAGSVEFRQALGEWPAGGSSGPLGGGPGVPSPPSGLQGASVLIRIAMGGATVYVQCQPGSSAAPAFTSPIRAGGVAAFAGADATGGGGGGGGGAGGAGAPTARAAGGVPSAGRGAAAGSDAAAAASQSPTPPSAGSQSVIDDGPTRIALAAGSSSASAAAWWPWLGVGLIALMVLGSGVTRWRRLRRADRLADRWPEESDDAPDDLSPEDLSPEDRSPEELESPRRSEVPGIR
jgi:hypothetical protein